MFDFLLRAIGCYDSNGLKYPISHLKNIVTEIPFASTHVQAKYVDRETKTDVQLAAWLIADQVGKMNTQDWYKGSTVDGSYLVNTTAVGNMAYIALHHPYEGTRRKAYQLLESYKNYRSTIPTK